MAKFVYIYHGGKSGATPAEQDDIMAAWGQWFGSLGDALVDGGNPFGAPKAVTAGNVADSVEGVPASGYSIVNADSHDAAVELAKGCPMLADSPSSVVEVYEAFPM
jgi:hypothetical protein